VLTRRVELPGRGTTQVWECPGPPGAQTIMLLHGVTFTAELNWGRVLEPLGRHYRVVALDQRGHGNGISAGSRFRLEDCADDAAALARVLGVRQFVAAGYSMGGIVAQLLYRRHPSLLSGLVLCATAHNILGSPMANLAALGGPTLAAAMLWNPMLRGFNAGMLGRHLLGYVSDTEIRQWASGQLDQTSLTTAISAMQAVYEFASNDWIGQVEIPTAVVVTTQDQIVSARRQRMLARAIPGAVSFEVPADHGMCINAPELFSSVLLQACRSVATATGQPVEHPRSGAGRTHAGAKRTHAARNRGSSRRNESRAEGHLAHTEVVDQTIQVVPRPVEAIEAVDVGRMQREQVQVQGHHPGRGPLAAAGGHRSPGAEAVHDFPQRLG
jgi:3-oxoadipate enol-lactonase